MPYSDPKTLVSTKWLSEHLKSPELRLIDASWYMPADNRDCRAEYEAEHIPGARFVDDGDVAGCVSQTEDHTKPIDQSVR